LSREITGNTSPAEGAVHAGRKRGSRYRENGRTPTGGRPSPNEIDERLARNGPPSDRRKWGGTTLERHGRKYHHLH